MSLDCAPSVQLLSFDFAYLDWSYSDLTSLCSASCFSALQYLESAVGQACGNYLFDFNNGEMTACQVVDLNMYKYQMSCLTDEDTDDYCLMQEQTWNISTLNSSGQATWPTSTNVTYPYYEPSVYYGFQYLSVDETTEPAGKHYSVDTQLQYSDNSNYGWPEYLMAYCAERRHVLYH